MRITIETDTRLVSLKTISELIQSDQSLDISLGDKIIFRNLKLNSQIITASEDTLTSGVFDVSLVYEYA